jgi:acyl carrier protein
MDNKARIREFIARSVRGHELRDDDDLFAGGFANSLFAMQMVQFVETGFGFTVEGEDMELDNFRSVDALSAFVERKTARPG